MSVDDEEAISTAPPKPEGEAIRLKALAEQKYTLEDLNSTMKYAKLAHNLRPSIQALEEILSAFRILSTASEPMLPSESWGMNSPPDYYEIMKVERFLHINTIRMQYKKLSLTLQTILNCCVMLLQLLVVKKLDRRIANQLKDEQFIYMVISIDRIWHANVVELMGYCSEHGQRLLIYEYCSNGTLLDTLHIDEQFKSKLIWNTRIRMALGATRALQYLHEICEPSIINRNFKSAASVRLYRLEL